MPQEETRIRSSRIRKFFLTDLSNESLIKSEDSDVKLEIISYRNLLSGIISV